MRLENVLVAAITHETNTFSPVPTPLEAFDVARGEEALTRYRDTGTASGGFIRSAARAGARIDVPLVARAPPSAPVEDAAFERLCAELMGAVRHARENGRCDALFLELHGAMVTTSIPDGEAVLLSRLYEQEPDLPVALSLDFHANVSDPMVSLPTSVSAYRTFPHLDMAQCAEKSAALTLEAMRSGRRPARAWGNLPLLVHLQRMATAESPWRELMARVTELEARPGVLAVNLLGGFPLADTAQAGLSCIVLTDEDDDLASEVVDELLTAAWAVRGELVMEPEPLHLSVRRARRLARAGGPLLILDVADTCNSGGTLDCVEVLREVLAQGLEDVAMAPVCDPRTVQRLLRAVPGASVEVELGGATPMPGVGLSGRPLRLRGEMVARFDGPLTVSGPVFTGTVQRPGPSALFRSGSVEIVITSRRLEPYDPGIFRCLGVDPAQKRFLILKSRMQCKPAFLPFSVGYVDCNGTGVTTSDLSAFEYRSVRRPIYPLDSNVVWPGPRAGARSGKGEEKEPGP